MTFNLVKATEDFLCRKRFRGHGDCHFYPSEASVVCTDKFGDRIVEGGCLRASYFRCTGQEARPHSVRTQSIFELGKHVEDMLVNNWKQMGILVDRGIRFQNNEFNISGELDAVLMDPETGKPFGVECKSLYGYHAGVEVFGNKSTPGSPKMNQLLQTLVYAYEFKDRLDYFLMFYEERGDGTKGQFEVKVVPDELEDGTLVYRPMVDRNVMMEFTIEDIYARYKELMKCILDGKVPDRDFELFYTNDRVEKDYANGKISKSKYEKFKRVSKRDGSVRYVDSERPGDWACSYCNFKDYCWK